MSYRLTRRVLFKVLGSVVLSLGSAAALAQGYPSKPVKIVVPYPPGGTTDIIGRLIAQELQNRMGQPFIVDNKAGAAGNIGADAVAKSAPDGYTLLLVASNVLAINPSLYKKLPYDPATAFAPVSNIATLGNVILVNPSNKFGIKTFQELVATAKKERPDTMNYGSTGNGSLLHLVGSVLVKVTATKINHIPYKGSAPMLQALYGNEVDLALDNLPAALPHVTSQKLKAVAITSSERSPLLPDVPTVAELGYPALNLTSWFGLVAPAGTDPQIVASLNKQIDAALKDKAVQERLVAIGTKPAPGSAASFGTFIKAEAARWSQIVKDSGATID